MSHMPGLAYLSDNHVSMMRDKVFTLLEQTGVKMEHPEVPALLAKAGAVVDSDSAMVRFPREVLEDLLALAPRTFTMAARDPARNIEVPRPGGGFHLRSCTGAYRYLDPATDNCRDVTLADLGTWARLADSLDQIDFIASPFPGDVPKATADIHALGTSLANTAKHAWIQPYSLESMPYLMDMVAAATPDGSAPTAGIIATALTPLGLKPMDLEAIMRAARIGMVSHVCSLPSAGGTAPLTMPGLVVLGAAEILAMTAAAQAVAPGAPVVALVNVYSLDMRSGAGLQSSVEAMQGAAMAMQFIKQAFGLPVHTYGLGCDSVAFDGQSMIERSLLSLLTGLGGADFLGGAGQLEVAKIISPLQLVIDDELIAMVRRLTAPMAVDDDSMAWSDLEAIAPGGHFLMTDHTLRHCHDGLMPRAFARQSRDAWEEAGGHDMADRTRDIHQTLMGKAAPLALANDAAREIDAIIGVADSKLAA